MKALLKTYVDIIALRKGPDAIPASWLILYASLGMLGIAWLVQLSLIDAPLAGVVPALVAYGVALAFYSAVVVLFGYRRRVMQMLSTVIACGSIIAVVSAVSGTLIAPLIGQPLASSVAMLIWFWSVPVKGHVIAKTIEKHWFLGIAIAMLAFVLRFGVESSLFIRQQGAVL